MRLPIALAVVVAVVVAAVVLVVSSGSSGGVRVPKIPPATVRAGTPPPPPHGALVLARGDGDLAVALAVRRAGPGLRLGATVIASDGTGLSALDVRFTVGGRKLPAAKPCGAGCYASSSAAGESARRVLLSLSGRGRAPSTVAFALPAHWPVSAAPLLRRAERVFAGLRSVAYRERLASGPTATTNSQWRVASPDRLSYRSDDGNAGVVIGATRWDLVVGGSWKRSPQNPPLVQPVPPWGAGAYDVTLLGGGRLGGRPVVRFSMFEPTTPAWYTVTLDRRTLRTLQVSMTATAHFMLNRYAQFDAAPPIKPPVVP